MPSAGGCALEKIRPRLAPAWSLAGALAAAGAAAGLLVGVWLGHPPAEDLLLDEVVTSHVASLTPGSKLVDVVCRTDTPSSLGSPAGPSSRRWCATCPRTDSSSSAVASTASATARLQPWSTHPQPLCKPVHVARALSALRRGRADDSESGARIPARHLVGSGHPLCRDLRRPAIRSGALRAPGKRAVARCCLSAENPDEAGPKAMRPPVARAATAAKATSTNPVNAARATGISNQSDGRRRVAASSIHSASRSS